MHRTPWGKVIAQSSYKSCDPKRQQWWYDNLVIYLGAATPGSPSVATGAAALPVAGVPPPPELGDWGSGFGVGSGRGRGRGRGRGDGKGQPSIPRQTPPPPQPVQGANVCWNCGSAGHNWQNCPLKWTPAISALAAKSKGKGKDKGKDKGRGRGGKAQSGGEAAVPEEGPSKKARKAALKRAKAAAKAAW